MYQNTQNASAGVSGSNEQLGSNASYERGQQSSSSLRVPHSINMAGTSAGSAPLKTIIDKRTYEQVFMDEKLKIKARESLPTPQLVSETAANIEQQPQYTATVYNIASLDVSPAPPSMGAFNILAKIPQAVPVKKHVVKQPAIHPTMEVISYKKSHANAYAKQLNGITRNSIQKLELTSRGEAQPLYIINHRVQPEMQTKVSSLEHAGNGVQNMQQHHLKHNTVPTIVPCSSYQGLPQKEIYQRLQAKQDRMQALKSSKQSLLIRNGESSRHPSDAPCLQQVRNTTEQQLNHPSTHASLQNKPKNESPGLLEPPPAHSAGGKMTTILPAIVYKQGQSNYQETVLNLDMKQHASSRTEMAMKLKEASDCRSFQGNQSNMPNTQQIAAGIINKLDAVDSKVKTVPVLATNGLATSKNLQQYWENLHVQNIQQLLAHFNATKKSAQQSKNNAKGIAPIPIQAETQAQSQSGQDAGVNCELQGTSYNLEHAVAPIFDVTATNEQILDKINQSLKRKNAGKEQEHSKKRKSKSKHDRPTEAYLQNGPCYKVAARLPRCRECGRSAATRSRHALNIFCRFYAFRKLKYNATGQLEVAGFADPNLDPKETDISLWSSNLQQVPVDLSVEKSKFLLGQVGYKFCELFHQEKEAYFEHLSEDKTIAWKQAVHGVREMCDVCQTTLFNHHWACTSCGFVVCIDCYKCRKNGSLPVESTTKDKDSQGWLLCSSTKEAHSQNRLMLTQIIPSNCLYKLVRQMHGICALLEIPLNCECPLSKEPLFRKIKEKLEFMYPVTVKEPTPIEVSSAYSDWSREQETAGKSTRMVSITIKNIEPVPLRRDDEPKPRFGSEPLVCKFEFSKKFHVEEKQSSVGDGTLAGGHGKSSFCDDVKEKQSYSFVGFQNEIHADGEHFDESLYKITSTPEADGTQLDTDRTKSSTDKEDLSIDNFNSSENGPGRAISNGDSDLTTSNKAPTNVTGTDEYRMDGDGKDGNNESINASPGKACSNNEGAISDECAEYHDDEATRSADEGMDVNKFDTSLKKESLELDETSENNARQKDSPDVSESAKGNRVDDHTHHQEGTMTVPYTEAERFRPSPPMDGTTFAMVVKQMVKFDKSFDIFSKFERHMACAADHLAGFNEFITVTPERIRTFLNDFLNDFVFLRGQNSSDDLTNEQQILEYNRQIKDGSRKFHSKQERKMHVNDSKLMYPDVAHEWLCNGKLLRLLHPIDVHNYQLFHDQWERGQPVMVSAVSSKMNMDLWVPQSFGHDFGEQVNDLVNCFNGKIVRGHPMKVFWEGFELIRERLVDERMRPMMLKLKDWPPGDDFAEMMPSRFYDLMKSLPLAEYTRREGRLNLASRLSSFFVRPDLGPKMYSAYGSALHPNKGTTNLHLDISDAVNVMVYVGVPTDVPKSRYSEKILEVIDTEDCDYLTRERIRGRKELPGALWHIYHAQDADKIRALLNKIELEKGNTIKPNHDPIHDQKWYLDRGMRRRLQQEYGVEGYAIVQCSGDAIFIPAGAPHQVRNLHNCIKVAEDFVSPENIAHCFKLTNEFRHLSKTHSNHEDKLQIKNIIYHTVKDAVSSITNPLIMTVRSDHPTEHVA